MSEVKIEFYEGTGDINLGHQGRVTVQIFFRLDCHIYDLVAGGPPQTDLTLSEALTTALRLAEGYAQVRTPPVAGGGHASD